MSGNWACLDEYTLLQIFTHLKLRDRVTVSQVCKHWYYIANDDWLWKQMFKASFNIQCPTLPPSAKSWKSEVKRLSTQIPKGHSGIELLESPHCEEIVHVAFSSDGQYFATCGLDSHVVLWNAATLTLIDYEDLTSFGWQAAQFCEFNQESSMLMVSGVLIGDLTGRIRGEIMVFTLSGKLKICARISNKPWDAFGCWYGNKYVISSEFKWLAHMVSTTMLLINKVSFALEKCSNDHTLACIRTLFRFYNSAGNAVRHLLVANICKDLGPEDPENQSGLKLLDSLDTLVRAKLVTDDRQALVNLSLDSSHLSDPLPREINNHFIKLLPSQRYEVLEESSSGEICFESKDQYFDSRRIAFNLGLEDNDWIFEDDLILEDEEEEDEDVQWEYYDNTEDKPDLVKIDEGHEVINEDDKLLIMATGTVASIPHMIGIKRMSKVRFRKDVDLSKSLAQLETERKSKLRRAQREHNIQAGDQILQREPHDWHDYKSVKNKFDGLDYLVEMHGRIVGMAITPCHRYLYVNVRPWPSDYLTSMTSVAHPPPVGSQVDRHVFDLGRMAFVSKQVHTQTAFVPSDPNPWSPICVTKHLIGSGNEGEHKAGIWDRHHGIKVAEFAHKDVVNAIAINPVDESLAVTVGDDMKIKVWRNK